MTKKKIHAVASECKHQDVEDCTDYYLDQVSNMNGTSLHFFDESSVIKTNDEPQIRQCYNRTTSLWTSEISIKCNFYNKPFTLLFSRRLCRCYWRPFKWQWIVVIFWISSAWISQDKAGLLYLREVIRTIIMDNCPFHQGRFIEQVLKEMLGDYGINLLFQLAYSPHLNPCELCFHQIKAFLNSNQTLAEHETEIAILEACSLISEQNSMSYFKHCGYIIWRLKYW